MDPGGSDLESSLPQAENPCLIVEDSQPDSVALEDDPDSSYRALLARRFSNLQPASHSPVLELISSPSKSRCSQSDCQSEKTEGVPQADNLQHNPGLSANEQSQVFEVCSNSNTKRRDQEDMDSRADSTTHCAQTEEGMSQFCLLELSESQGLRDRHDGDSSDEDVEATPANLLPPTSLKPAGQMANDSSFKTSGSQDGRSKRPEVSSSSPSDPQRTEGRKLSVQAILHSQLPESVEAEDEEIVSSQDDLFDGSTVDSTVAEPEKQEPTSTPAHSLHLLHLSGQGTLVQESLSQQSVDFVAATQDDISHAPIIVPNSPTGQENEHECDEVADSPMDTSGPPEDQGHGRGEEPMDMEPVPKPTTSTPVSQNSPKFALEKNLSLPTQPEFSHDVFVPTPCLESGDCSQSADTSKRKVLEKENPSTTQDAGTPKALTAGRPLEVANSLRLALDSEKDVSDEKTQVFPVDDGSQDTQIEDIGGTVGVEEKGPGPAHQNENSNKDESCLGKIESSQQVSQGSDVESSRADCGRNEEVRPSQKSLSPSANEQDANVSGGTANSQSAADEPLARRAAEGAVGKDLTDSACSQSTAPVSGGAVSAQVNKPSVTTPNKSAVREEDEGGLGFPKLSQPVSQSLRSVGNAEDGDREEDDERMDEDEVQSTSRSEVSRLGLALSPSQARSPEPMEQGGEGSEPTASGGRPAGGKAEESFSVTVLEESQRASQEKVELERSQAFRSASQPVSGSLRETGESARKATSSQPSGSGVESSARSGVGPQVSKTGDGGGANKSLSDSSDELPFHFTLPRDGELMGAAVSTTPPHVRLLKKTPLHSTPIETSSLHDRAGGDVTGETTVAASEISVEESVEGVEPSAVGGDGKLSLRMKVVSPLEEGSPGSDRFSLQKPALSDEEGSVSKATTVVKAVTSPSVFSRVREVHRQLQVEETRESGDQPLRHPSTTAHSLSGTGGLASPDRPLEAVGNGTAGGLSRAAHRPSQQPNGTVPDAEPLVTAPAQAQPLAGGEQEAPSTSGQACGTPLRQRAVSQQTSIDFPSATSPVRKRAVSQQTSLDISGGRSEPVTPPRSQPGPSHRRHVRTVQEVRTTVTRIITDVYYEDGREVERKVVEESEEPVVERCVVDSDVSPSRTGSSMTSGDLADVSSISSKAPSHHSSSGTSSGGPGPSRAADFVMPAGRGAKSGSPRRGGRQPMASVAAGSEFMGVLGSPGTAAPLSPRGYARRGRPPSRTTMSRGGRGGHRGGAHSLAASSSEEDLLARPVSRVLGRSDSLNAASPESGGGTSSFVGLRVMAKWSSNSYFYSGTITRDLGESHFRVLFDDNQECEVQGRDVLLCDPIPVEAEVTALTEEEYFNMGLVKGHKRQGSELLYCVEKDGQTAWYGRTAVILTMEQGNRLREQHGLGPYEPLPPPVMASDISLDNLVEGKRRRRGNGSGPGTPTRGATNSPRTPGKRKLSSSVEEEKTPAKRGRRGGGARVGSRGAACNTSGSGAELPADPNDLVLSHGPLPESTSLFMGFVFMLTYSSEHDREVNETTCDEGVQTAPYNKRYTERQLEAGGGMILPEFNEEQCKAAYQSLLIADQHCRTRTYLLCVAGGVPCVSQVWVRDCCQEKKLMNYRNYLLPSGLGPEKRIIEWHARCNPFKALKVLLFAENRVDLWSALLTMCGAAKVHQHKTNGNGSDVPAERFDVVVSAQPCSPDLLKWAAAADTPVVSLEWLVQSVICGERLAYAAQPEYRPDNSA
ncbi:TP53-binding protein 1 isoform X2 [Brachyhypopomus gauderio]|uniref:TP53-binding protein 1 isoform X2 n=1 Tax=Brachyhypopomus gauderio TaxID=698409 RepID=UPI00404267DB